nr:hypothetical protein BgiMline_033560 [Biomphalaria glabrata]
MYFVLCVANLKYEQEAQTSPRATEDVQRTDASLQWQALYSGKHNTVASTLQWQAQYSGKHFTVACTIQWQALYRGDTDAYVTVANVTVIHD